MNSYIYKERLQWINQVQLFRTELADIRFEVIRRTQESTILDTLKTDWILETVSSLNEDLDATDLEILTSLNHEKAIWGGKCSHLHVFRTAGEASESLFDRMKQHFIEVLNFQRSVDHFLSEQPKCVVYESYREQRTTGRRAHEGIQRAVSISKNGIL